MFKDTLFDI